MAIQPQVKLPKYGRDFVVMARAAMLGGLDEDRAELAARLGGSRDLVGMLQHRSAVPPATTGGGGWAGDLLGDEEGYQDIVQDFSATLTAGSSYMRLLLGGQLATVPSYSQIGFVATDLNGVIVDLGEGKPTVISSMAVDRLKVAPSKAGVLVVTTEEMARAAPSASGLFEKQLRQAASYVIDKKAFVGFTDGLSGTAATVDVLNDLSVAINAVDCRSGALHWIAGVDTIKSLCTAKAVAGSLELLFEDLSPQGGSLLNLPCLVSEGIASDSLMLVNPSLLATSFEGITISRSRNAAVEMQTVLVQDSTTETGASLVSLWQNNLVGIRVIASLMATRVRDSAIKEITGCAWAA